MVTTLEMIDKIRDIVLSDRRSQFIELVEAEGSVTFNLHEELFPKKITTKMDAAFAHIRENLQHIFDSVGPFVLSRWVSTLVRNCLTKQWMHQSVSEMKQLILQANRLRRRR